MASYTRAVFEEATNESSITVVLEGYSYSRAVYEEASGESSLELVLSGFSYKRAVFGQPGAIAKVETSAVRVIGSVYMVSVSTVSRLPFEGNALYLGGGTPLICFSRGYRYACYQLDGTLVSSGDASSNPGVNGGAVVLAGGYGLLGAKVDGFTVTVYGLEGSGGWQQLKSYDLSSFAQNNNISSIEQAFPGYDGSGYPLLLVVSTSSGYALAACESSGTCHMGPSISNVVEPLYATSVYTSNYALIATSGYAAIVYSGGALFETSSYPVPGCSGYYYLVDLDASKVYVKSIDISGGSLTTIYTYDYSRLYTIDGFKQRNTDYGVLVEPLCIGNVKWGFIIAAVADVGVANAVYSDGSTVAVSLLDYNGMYKLDPSVFDDSPIQVYVCSDNGSPGACQYYMLPLAAGEVYVR